MLSAVGQIMTQKPISSQKKDYFLTTPNGNRSMDKMLPCITRSFQTVPVIWRLKTSHLTIIVSKFKANYVFEWQKSSNKFIICNIEMIMQNVTWNANLFCLYAITALRLLRCCYLYTMEVWLSLERSHELSLL